MSSRCCNAGCSTPVVSPGFRKALWLALAINLTMFVVEIISGLRSGSVSLLADAIDFAGDAANYAITLTVLSMGLIWRARAAMLKGASMLAFGMFVLGRAGWSMYADVVPEPMTMGVIGVLAFVANVVVALMLYAFREGDSNMRSVWLCSRNDAIGNIAVIAAAAGVLGTGSAWPDLIVALIMAGLALSAGFSVVRQARQELGTLR